MTARLYPKKCIMLLRFISCTFLILLYNCLSGQTGAPTIHYLYYQITAEETLALLAQKEFDPSPQYFHTAIEGPNSKTISSPELPVS